MIIEKKRGEIDLKFFIICLNIAACFARTLWFLDPHPNSTPFGVHLWSRSTGGMTWSIILLKTTQLSIIAGILSIALVWKKLIMVTRELKKVRGLGNLPTIVAINIFILFLIVMPFHIIGAVFAIEMLDNIGNYILMTYILVLVCASAVYMISLQRELRTLKGSGRGVIVRIRNTVILMFVGGTATLLGGFTTFLGWAE